MHQSAVAAELLFDEADALLDQWSEVKAAHDRSIHLEMADCQRWQSTKTSLFWLLIDTRIWMKLVTIGCSLFFRLQLH